VRTAAQQQAAGKSDPHTTKLPQLDEGTAMASSQREGRE
jgi:hypothetical protein